MLETKKYSFNYSSLVLFTLFNVLFTAGILYAASHFIKQSLIVTLLFAVPLVGVLFAIPLLVRFWVCFFKGKPAIELNGDCLILNLKAKSFKWGDIKSFTFRVSGSFRSSPKGFIEIAFISNQEIETIQLIQINVESHEILESLNYYLKAAR